MMPYAQGGPVGALEAPDLETRLSAP
jgi:hypothetical protein